MTVQAIGPVPGESLRTGLGVDAHRFLTEPDPAHPLKVCGLAWEGEGSGIDGDSDGDVAVHALIDAALSAAGAGDIGSFFGVGPDSRGAGMDGIAMLEEVAAALRAARWVPVNAAVTVIGNRPKIGRRRGEAQEALSGAMGCPVSVCATTSDGMGFTGRGEGIAAMATALLRRADEARAE